MAVSEKDAVIALLKAEIYNIESGDAPLSDYFVPTQGAYRFDVTKGEIDRFLRFHVSYRVCPDVALLEVETVKKLMEMKR